MRLIEVKKNGEWALKGVEQEALCAGKVITEELRQKLYGALCKLRDYENTGLSPEDVERVNNFGESQVERLMKKLQEEQEKHRWIPVGERLPEFGEYVMISFSNFSLPIIGKCDRDEEGIMWFAGDELESLVSHNLFVNAWQPLPEPYEEGADARN